LRWKSDVMKSFFFRFAKAAAILFVSLLWFGCFVGTPKEELLRLSAEIVPRAAGGVRVSLADTSATDSALEYLTALCANHSEYDFIAELDLAGTSITDHGLRRLTAPSLERLEILDLSRTRCTPEGLRIIRETLPNCTIRY
jgi:hypothetical protein